MNPRAIIILMVGLGIASLPASSQTQPSSDCHAVAGPPQLTQAGPQTQGEDRTQAGGLPICFRRVEVCDAFVGGYQVAVADVNGDGRLDILAVGEHPGTVDWFENPGKEHPAWQRHPISGPRTRRNIDLAVNDVDRDGRLDVAVASDFDLGHSDEGGTVSLFHRQARQTPEWTVVPIHAEPTAHRIRWADIDGDGRKELITVPIAGKGAKLPGLQDAPARLLCHWIPRDPVHDAWPEQIIDQSLTVVHGVFVMDWDGDGRDELLTASNQGIHLFKAQGVRPTTQWMRTRLAAGHRGQPPNCGASEVYVGRTHKGVRFLAAIEPWHGHEVVVYTQPPGDINAPAPWPRSVIDDSLRAGHALCCADFDGDGGDEIIAGYRGEGTSLYGYRRVPGTSERWERFAIDAGGIAAQGCVAADVDGDGRMDLVAVGGTTHNVRLYLNPRLTP